MSLPVGNEDGLRALQYDRPGDVGRLGAIVEARRTTELTHDEVGRLLSETVRENGVAAALTTGYTWDANGQLGTLSYPSGLAVAYERDPVTKTVTEVRNTSSGTRYASGVSYWPAGPLRHLTFGNGTELDHSYNLRYEPRSIASGPVALTYEPTPAGNIGAVTSDAVRSGYGYDMLDRLVVFSPGRTADARALRYEYAGDRVTAAYTYGPPNTLVYAYGYDDQSNLSAISVYDSTGTTITQTLCLKHDALGRLVLFGRTAPGNGGPDRLACRREADVTEVIARFEYDARNRRVARYSAAAGTWTQFAFLPDGSHLAELTRPTSPGGAWAPARDYVWIESTPLAQVERTLDGPSGRPYYFHVDHLGLPRALTDPGGLVAWRAETLPYGDLFEQPGASVVTNLRLPGQYDERLFAAAGLSGLQGPYYNWNRWYLPSMGRYLELDPIAVAGGFNGPYGPNWYGYAEANPLIWTDPSGLFIWWNPYFGGDPATQLGLLIGFIGSRQLPSVSFSWKTGIVWEFPNNKIQDAIGGYSTTYAHAICHSTPNTGVASVQRHELQHVIQSNYLGPFYLPAHIGAQLYSYVTTGTYEKNNPLEWGPYSNPPVPFAPRPPP